MDGLNLADFDPTVAELTAMVEATRGITANDLEDPKQLSVVKENRISLKNARVKIEKTGKALREDALKFQKAVIAKEKELVAIIEPEEDRLQAIEDEAKQIAEMKKRAKELPARREQLAALNDGIEITDDEILKRDDIQFGIYINSRKEALLEKQRLEMEERERAVREAEEKTRREAELAEAAERARVQEREKLEREAKAAEDKRIADEARDRERKAAEEKALQAQVRYQNFLKENGYTDDEQFKIVDNGKEVQLYKLVATYTK